MRPMSGLSSMATRALLAAIADAYGARSDGGIVFESVGGVDAARRVRAGEPFDVVVLASGAMAALAADGHLVAGSLVDLAVSPMALAVPTGRPLPALADAEAVRRAMLDAERIGYSTGPSGETLTRLLAEWGIADVLADRLVQAPPGVPVGTLLADGRATLGVQQLSEFAGVPGIEVAGALPSALGTDTTFTAGLPSASGRAGEAGAFLRGLGSGTFDSLVRRHGMTPPRTP